MRKIELLSMAAGFILSVSCDTIDAGQDEGKEDGFQEIRWEQDVTGQLNPWDLVENPAYYLARDIAYLNDTESVFVIKVKESMLVYPLRYMGVEVVNVESEGELIAVTYCPITKSANAWNRIMGADTLLLTPSGYLLRDNLMPMDLNSGSIWSQMRLEGMFGKHDMVTAKTLPLLETSWKTVRTYFPEAEVFTGGGQKKSSSLAGGAGIEGVDTGRQLGILGREQVELFSPDLFPGQITLLHTLVQPGGTVVLAGSQTHQFIVAFQTNYDMIAVEGQFPTIMRDETGTDWNIFGEAVKGERKGEHLESPVYYTALVWAWESLFAEVTEFGPS